jgi:hypothetical protein
MIRVCKDQMNGKPAIIKSKDVSISVFDQDPSLLRCLINRAASRSDILDQLNRALCQLAPYRAIDPIVFRGVQLYRDSSNLSFADVSKQLCGDERLKWKIRYWFRALFGKSPDVVGEQ